LFLLNLVRDETKKDIQTMNGLDVLAQTFGYLL
jgi:hypothetical protein